MAAKTTAKTTAKRPSPSGVKSRSAGEAASERKQQAKLAELEARIERLERAAVATGNGNLSNVREIMDVDQDHSEDA